MADTRDVHVGATLTMLSPLASVTVTVVLFFRARLNAVLLNLMNGVSFSIVCVCFAPQIVQVLYREPVANTVAAFGACGIGGGFDRVGNLLLGISGG